MSETVNEVRTAPAAPPPGTVPAVLVRQDAGGTITVEPGTAAITATKPAELLVRPAYVGVCGTDIEILHGSMPETFKINYPHVLGHEWSGIVVEVGAGVEGFHRGDRVLGHGHLGGNDWFGVTHDGAAAELFTVPADMCFHIPDEVDMLTAAVIEPFACVLNGLTKIGGISAADTVHVHGLGAIGLNAVIQAVTAGAQVVAFDPSPLRREMAIRLGAKAAVNPLEETVATAAAEQAVGRPFADVVIEASGNSAAQAAALESADLNGRVLLMGVSTPKFAPARLGLVQERNLLITSSTGAPVAVWPAAIRYVANTRLNLGEIVSTVVPFSRGDEALQRAQDSSRETKVMLAPDATNADGVAASSTHKAN
ncbi:D-arabitol-phosphate dehydrogenase [Arthrobacter sp. Bi26]|uniref:zinc-dependent alcohol dehydrogenase n=1 Tax=Arthrobacter sp. Bi26 TaxID=2822350 RepID=UPI001D24E2EA|nr:medium chain dehydrogenase/reductase family protein [Arthrobacter sp. Bi26]CAH0199966.1 D-arabitol-phosphate dehydrogenase [Arthrobacter sp. Bi26]